MIYFNKATCICKSCSHEKLSCNCVAMSIGDEICPCESCILKTICTTNCMEYKRFNLNSKREYTYRYSEVLTPRNPDNGTVQIIDYNKEKYPYISPDIFINPKSSRVNLIEINRQETIHYIYYVFEVDYIIDKYCTPRYPFVGEPL